jgi:hypothetical protein
VRQREFALTESLDKSPDVIRTRERDIIDYKSGPIFELDETSQAEVVKAAYARQLRTYGYLVKETLGWWPKRGTLLPSVGAGADIALDPSDCTRDATEAVELLNAYNTKLRESRSSAEIASPSPGACKWCPFKILCPAFWKAASSGWSGMLDGAAIEGILVEPPRAIQAGAAAAVSLQLDAGTETLRLQQLAPLNPQMHPIVSSLSCGDRIRFVGLRVRPDSVLVPTERTVLVRVNDLPDVALPGSGSN